MFVSVISGGCAVQLSTIKAIVQFVLNNSLSHFFNQPSDIFSVIHALAFESYMHGKVLQPRDHLGFLLFPIIRSGSFSVPFMFAQTRMVTRPLLFLPPARFSPFKT